MSPKIVKYSWKSFDRDTQKLIRLINKSNYKPQTIVAIAKGGLPLGVKLSNLLLVPLTIISAKSYKGTIQNSLMLNASYTVPLQSPVLLVDEVVDTGHTMSLVKEHLQLGGVEIRTATLFYKEKSTIKPNWSIHKIEETKWLIFPWEI